MADPLRRDLRASAVDQPGDVAATPLVSGAVAAVGEDAHRESAPCAGDPWTEMRHGVVILNPRSMMFTATQTSTRGSADIPPKSVDDAQGSGEWRPGPQRAVG